MPFPEQATEKPPIPAPEETEGKPPAPPEEEKKDEPMGKEMTLVAEKLAEMTAILKEIQTSLLSADSVVKEKEGAVVTEISSPTVDGTEPESASMKGKPQSDSPPTKRSGEPMVKEGDIDRVLAKVRKELKLGSVNAPRMETEEIPAPQEGGDTKVKSFVKEALGGKKMTLQDIQEVYL